MILSLKKKYNTARIFAYIAILGGLEGISSILIAAIIFFSKIEFNIYLYWVSQLGVTPEINGYIFNYGLGISAILLLWGVYVLNKFLAQKTENHKRIRQIAFFSASLCSFGIIFLSIFHLETILTLHTVGAYFFFFNASIFTGCYTYILQKIKIGNKFQKIVTYFLVFVCLEFLFLIILNTVSGDVSTGNMLGSTNPALGTLRILEWQLLLFFFLWLFSTGYSFYKYSKAKGKSNF